MPAHWYYSVHGECLEKGKYRHPDCIVYGLHVLNGGYAASTSLGSGRPVFVPTHFGGRGRTATPPQANYSVRPDVADFEF